MRKTIKLAVVAALALGSTSAFATNGDNMIGQGAQSRSMGGVGIAKSFGASSSLANPALISSVEKSEFTGGITFFMPDVNTKSDNALLTGASRNGVATDSDADFSVIPELYYASRINSNLIYGITLAGTAGMGTDFDDTTLNTANVNRMKTELGLMKIAVPIAYNINKFTLGVSPVLQYGTLKISHLFGGAPGTLRNNGKSSDTGFGYELGATYEASKAVTVGVVYKSKIGMNYTDVLAQSIKDFGADPVSTGGVNAITSGDNLDQPAEYGVGVSYNAGANTIAFDYKRIEWGSAAGYKDFGWEDQDVIAIGYEYATKMWALRAGYNYAKSPIKEQTGTGGAGSGTSAYKADVQNFFNMSGFPGIVESHYTFGGGYNFSDALSMDLAVVYAKEATEQFSIGNSGSFGPGATIDVKHSQLGLTVAATYKF